MQRVVVVALFAIIGAGTGWLGGDLLSAEPRTADVAPPPLTAAAEALPTPEPAPAPSPPPPLPTPTAAPVEAVHRPTRVRVPAIDVDAAMVPLGRADDGTLEVPTDFATAGWWTEGPEPGEPGPSVIAGHVDSVDGPAVFYRLRELAAGDRITVEGDDGRTATFAVTRVEQHAKDAFPTQAVYGDTAEPTLRLVTCAGGFDRGSGHYLDNLIVYARAVVEG